MFRKQYTTRQKQTVLSYLTTHTPKETSIHYGIHISMVIINMDETPVYFNNPSKKTIHYGLTKDPVAVKVMEGNQRARVTVMLTCTRAGTCTRVRVLLNVARIKQHAQMLDLQDMKEKEVCLVGRTIGWHHGTLGEQEVKVLC
jgi:hypothetical protein